MTAATEAFPLIELGPLTAFLFSPEPRADSMEGGEHDEPTGYCFTLCLSTLLSLSTSALAMTINRSFFSASTSILRISGTTSPDLDQKVSWNWSRASDLVRCCCRCGIVHVVCVPPFRN